MSGSDLLSIPDAAECLRQGRVIAYPTEAVYGLGCDPGCESAVREILRLKSRPESAGLILIADRFEFLEPFSAELDAGQRERALGAWPGPVTWLFPRASEVPDWLAGSHPTVALRLTAHPVTRALCAAFGGAIVSTSANPGGQEPARSAKRVDAYFGDSLCGIVGGSLGEGDRPSEIRDLASGRVIRAA